MRDGVMAVSGTPSSLQAILSQLDPATPPGPVRSESPVRAEAAAREQVRNAAAEPRVNLPKDATTLNPNAPRGTYLNLTV